MKKIKLKLNKCEYDFIVDTVNEFRNEQLKKGKTVDFISELLEKLLVKI